jgi:hypothetical protein
MYGFASSDVPSPQHFVLAAGIGHAQMGSRAIIEHSSPSPPITHGDVAARPVVTRLSLPPSM